MTKKWIESARGAVCYWISRKTGAPVLVFLHGFGADHTLFAAQLEYFARAYTVIAWDEPGWGESRPYAECNMLHAATELRRILEAEGIERCVLIGHSLGGMLAQTFIDHWPEKVRGFVGIGTCPMDRSFYSRDVSARIERIPKLARLFPFRTLHAWIARRSCRSPQARAQMKRALRGYGRDELCALAWRDSRALVHGLEDARLVRCPVLLLVGEKDRVGRVRALCRAWRERTGAPLYRVRGAGHAAQADNPRSANRLIAMFLNKLR